MSFPLLPPERRLASQLNSHVSALNKSIQKEPERTGIDPMRFGFKRTDMNKKVLIAALAVLAAAAACAYIVYSRRKKPSGKITVNMRSAATTVPGQGVGSAYMEQVKLIKEDLGDKYEVTENAHIQADITHYHTINPGYLLEKPIASAKGRSVGYVHMLPETIETSLKLPGFAKSVFYKYMIKFYDSMDYLVVVNPYFIDRLEHYGIDRKKVTYIPNYVSSEKFHPLPQEEKMKLRDKYGIPRDKFVVVCAGQTQVRKGFFDFVEIAEKRPDMEFAWAGGFSFGAITDGYKEISKIMENPPANLKLLGIIPRDEMNEIYNIGDVMFLPSFEELFPMTILEAMCVNIPILLRDLDIYNNILFDFYYRETSVDGFINELVKLRDDPDYYADGVEASKRGNKFYSKEHVVKMWDEFYTKVYNRL